MREIFLQSATLWQREIVRFIRQPIRVMSAIATPLVFWLLLGAGLQASFKPRGMPAGIGYAQYFYPGVIVLMLLFTAIFATASTVDDRRQGFLQGVLVAPISRATIVLGQALGCTTLSLMQGAIFLAMAPLAGIRLSLEAIVVSAAMMAVIALAMTSIGLAMAWRTESTQGFHAFMNMLLLPIWMLSGAVFPVAGAPAWFQWTTRLNPLTYAVDRLRRGACLAGGRARGGCASAGTVSRGAGLERCNDADGIVGGDCDRVCRVRLHPGDARRAQRLNDLRATQRGGIRSAPSRRIVSPLSIPFSTMWRASAAYSDGLPSRCGNGICAASALRFAWGKPASIGVSKVPGAIVQTRMPSDARSRAIGNVIETTPPFDAE